VLGSLVVYLGLVLLGAKAAGWVVRKVRGGVARPGAPLGTVGAALTIVGFALPAPEFRVAALVSHLDSIAPAWQFNERHQRTVAAPPEVVYRAATQVRADEIFLFRALTWIRRGGRDLQPGVLNPGVEDPLLDVAVRGGFVRVVDAPPRELVFGSAVVMPRGQARPRTPAEYRAEQIPGTVMATMNFLIVAHGTGSRIATETRVHANDPATRRRFAVYWRLIYPGSALIRRNWLAAIERRAVATLAAEGARP